MLRVKKLAYNSTGQGIGGAWANLAGLILPPCDRTDNYILVFKVNLFCNPSSYGRVALAIDGVVIAHTECYEQAGAATGNGSVATGFLPIRIKKGEVASVQAIEQAGTFETTPYVSYIALLEEI